MDLDDIIITWAYLAFTQERRELMVALAGQTLKLAGNIAQLVV